MTKPKTAMQPTSRIIFLDLNHLNEFTKEKSQST